MNKRITAVAVAGTLGLGAVGAVTLAYPAIASTPTPSPSGSAAPAPAAPNAQDFQARREAAIKQQLKSLVDDGTLTQAQADKVAAKLATAGPMGDRGPGRGGPGFGGPGRDFGGPLGIGFQQLEDAAAKALGLSTDDLRTQLRSGSTIADLAKKQNKSLDSVVTAIVQSARTQLAQAVKDKKITQAQADQIDKNLPATVKTFAENGRMKFEFHGGPGMGKGMPSPGDLPSLPTPGATTESSSFFGNA